MSDMAESVQELQRQKVELQEELIKLTENLHNVTLLMELKTESVEEVSNISFIQIYIR